VFGVSTSSGCTVLETVGGRLLVMVEVAGREAAELMLRVIGVVSNEKGWLP
jgi:hypothetical protein